MTVDENPRDDDDTWFSGERPRWREDEETPPGEVEKHRRDRMTDAPPEDSEGAIERE
jgi:hypothetical protein